MNTERHKSSLSRRQFLIRSGGVVGGLTLLTSCQSILPAFPSLSDPADDDHLLWVQLRPDGQVGFYCPRMEMGQGTALGLSQIIAAELNLTQDRIQASLASTADLPAYKMTVGSEGISLFSGPVAKAAALLRETMRQRIAALYNLKPEQLIDAHGGFNDKEGRFMDYRLALEDGSAIYADTDLNDLNPPLYSQRQDQKSPIGESWPHPDIRSIVTGQMRYSRDILVPGTLFAGVFRAPFIGATLDSVDWKETTASPEIVKTLELRDHNFVAVIARDPISLKAVMEQVHVTWHGNSEANTPNPTSDWLKPLGDTKGSDFEHVLFENGQITPDLLQNEIELNADYRTPYAAHAQIEPKSATASATADKLEVWCGTQDPYFVRARIAKLTERNEDDIIVHPQRMGGGFGGRVYCPAAEEAALISHKIGRPVRVQWERADEFQNSYFQAPFSHQIKARVGQQGKITQWRHDFLSSPIITALVDEKLSWAVDMFVADKGTARGALSPYQLDNQRIRYSDIRTEIPVGAWRGLGSAPNAFAIESMINELATAAKIDPFEIRLRNLSSSENRLAQVLKELKEFCRWEDRSLSSSSGMGIAASIYKGVTRAAVAVEVQFDRDLQEIKISQVWCVQDSGRVINPDQVENQIAGNIIWGCSMALKERLNFTAGKSSASNFDTYEILRHSDAPKINIKLIDPFHSDPSAVGEAALPPVPAAIAQAVYTASGQRQRQLPISLTPAA